MIAAAMLPPDRYIDLPRDAGPHEEPEELAPRRPGTLLPWTIKVCLTLGLVALGTSQYLSRTVGNGTPRQREAQARLQPMDPETTGSIGAAAAHITLDPCTASDLRR